MSRRRFLALSTTVTLAACASDDSASPAETEPTDTTPPDTTPADTTTTTTSTTTPTASSTTTIPAETTTTEADAEELQLDADPFVFGVASGDPDADSVVLWTRLAAADELPPEGIDVTWWFEPDDGSATLTGTALTDPSQGWTIHAIAAVPGPGTYWFSTGGWVSPEGRAAPLDAAATEFRIATASCQNYEAGFYAAHRDIAAWQPDLVVFLGDFIYEGFSTDLGDERVRLHDPVEPTTLDEYRGRYATYLGDPQLQASRGAAPWLAIWDDHEVDNDYAGLASQDDDDPAVFAERRQQAYRAWWENTATRLDPPDPADPTAPFTIHRGLDVGNLLRISALDGRQFRDDQVSDAILDIGPPAEGWDDPARTMLGGEQEAWLIDRFATSSATWNCLAQQTVLSDVRLGESILNYDQWDGYVPARERLLAAAPTNFVTITGDIHLAGVGRLGTADAAVGVEFVTTAISSTANVDPLLTDLFTGIPAIVDAELEFRGYTRHVVTPEAWSAEFRQVVDIASADSEVRTWKTFRVEAGSPAVAEVA